jgi:1-acyl-sn-glycerol-3-phosphate acyltransferase
MLYAFLKLILRFAARQYFREIRIHNYDKIPQGVPLMFLPNHTSAFMDPIVTATSIHPQLHFLARGESFQNPIMAKVFSTLHMIPIYRREHTPDDVFKNDDVFIKCFELLEAKGNIMIFPEGVSQMEAKLMPLKTGAARIALGAEARNDFKLGLCMIPVGINYTNSHMLQEKVFLNFGDPIYLSEFKDAFEENRDKTIHSLTKTIEEELKRRIVIVNDDRWLNLAEKADMIIQSAPKEFEGEGAAEKHSAANWYLSKTQILDVIDYVRKTDGEQSLLDLEDKVDRFFSSVMRINAQHHILNPLGKTKNKAPGLLLLFLYFVGMFPLFILGLILHYLPYKLTDFLAGKIVKRDDFKGSVLLALGLLLFVIFGFFESWLLYRFTGILWLSVVFAVIWPFLGLLSFRYWIRLRRLISGGWLWKTDARSKKILNELEKEKQDFIIHFKELHARSMSH